MIAVKNMRNNLCIYCGKNPASTRDHVPPKSFFPRPRPANLITVPSCEDCNNVFGKDDERVRNIITSIHTTEVHPAICQQIADKRNRSFQRSEGFSNFLHLVSSIKLTEHQSDTGDYFHRTLAFNLDQKVFDRFVERMTRALLFYENGIKWTELDIKWKLSPNIQEIPSGVQTFLLNGQVKVIGEDVFTYVGYFLQEKVTSLWFMNFYDGFEIMSLVRAVKEID